MDIHPDSLITTEDIRALAADEWKRVPGYNEGSTVGGSIAVINTEHGPRTVVLDSDHKVLSVSPAIDRPVSEVIAAVKEACEAQSTGER